MILLPTYSAKSFHSFCDKLAALDTDIDRILRTHGYPGLGNVRPNTFETLVHFILEQQVSMASALGSLNKLRETAGGITPENVAALTEETLRASYLSRQKAGYVRQLALNIVNGDLDLDGLAALPNEEVRAILIHQKGIGNWTIDVYLMFVLLRADVFPAGDLAIARNVIRLKKLAKDASRDEILAVAESWKPYRSIAAIFLWHYNNADPMKREPSAPKKLLKK